jgi:peroxiredoxin (alkyl hydroperoxide reductase subunit C)
MTTGRNVGELLRLVLALQASDEHHALTPESWQPSDPMLEPVAGTYADAAATADRDGAADWYYRAKVYKSKAKAAKT